MARKQETPVETLKNGFAWMVAILFAVAMLCKWMKGA